MRHRLATALASLFVLAIAAPSAQAAPPSISGTAFSEATTGSVSLEAEVDPLAKATKYHFEYGSGDCGSNPCTSTPEGSLAGASPKTLVTAPITGLTPGTTYHFRAVATNSSKETSEGPDQAFTTYRPPQVFPPCPANEAFRAGKPSARLPDCRAYEQASPVQKNSLDARGRVAFARTSPAGDRVTFATAGGVPGGEGSQEMPVYLASREGGSWSTQGLLPPAGYGEEAFVLGWSPDLAQVFDGARRFDGSGGATFLSRDTASEAVTTIAPYGGGIKDIPNYVGTSADGSLVAFESRFKLASLPAALEGKPNVYLWDRDTGTTVLAGVMNDGSPPPNGAFAGPYDWIAPGEDVSAFASYYRQDEHAISADGSVFFTSAVDGELYLRRNPTAPQSAISSGQCTEPDKACTLPVSASQRSVPDPLGSRPAAFIGASPDGSKALLTSPEELTDDANTGPPAEHAPAIARSNPAGGEVALDFLPADAEGIAIAGDYVYWADPEGHAIGRAKLNGAGDASEKEPHFITPGPSEFETHPLAEPGVMHSAPATPRYVTVEGEYIYWTNTGPLGGDKTIGKEIIKEERPVEGAGMIGRAKLGPSGPEDIEESFIEGATNPLGIDAEGEYLYWSNGGNDDATRTIGRAKAEDGGEVDQEFIAVGEGSQKWTPQGLAVNSTHIYAGINGTQEYSYVFRWDIDGEPASWKFFGENQGIAVKGVAVDSTYLYWAREGDDAIGRIPLADFGSASTCGSIVTCDLEFVEDAGNPIGLAADSEHLYWSANQSVPPNPGNDLYRWQEATGELTDLTPDSTDENGAEVIGVLGHSTDLSAVYFVANADLDGLGPAQAGDCKGSAQGIIINYSGECSLYVVQAGEPIEFIARLGAAGPTTQTDALNWVPRGGVGDQDGEKTARVSEDGQTLLFRSQEQLTPYENEGTAELYRYRAGEGIGCVSCKPTGEAPGREPDFGRITLSFLVPGASSYVLSRNLSADGNRVFFETTDALVGEDVNGQGGCPTVGPGQGKYPVCLDAYEWEAKGTGTCDEDIMGGGCIYLLSSGTSPDASYIFDASASGDEVFLATRDPLVPQDEDQLYDVYDASVEGGLASQHARAPEPCEAEGCRPEPRPPLNSESPGSASFAGPSDPHPKASRNRHGRKHKKKKRHRRHRKAAARANRGAGR